MKLFKVYKEKTMLRISFGAGLVCAAAEFIFSIYSNSQSVLTDAVFDTTELFLLALVLFLTPLFYKPISEKYPYGFFQVESIFLIVKSFMMLAVSLAVSVDIIGTAISGGNLVREREIALFELASGLFSVVIYLILRGKKHSLASPTVNAELLEWKLDIGLSFGMALAFYGASYLRNTPLFWLSPYFDQIVAVCVMVLMLPDCVRILIRSMRELFLFSPGEETVDLIKSVSVRILEENRFHPVFFDITQTGRHIWAAIYFEVPDGMVDIALVRKTSEQINRAVRAVLDNCTCEMILAPDPESELLPDET